MPCHADTPQPTTERQLGAMNDHGTGGHTQSSETSSVTLGLLISGATGDYPNRPYAAEPSEYLGRFLQNTRDTGCREYGHRHTDPPPYRTRGRLLHPLVRPQAHRAHHERARPIVELLTDTASGDQRRRPRPQDPNHQTLESTPPSTPTVSRHTRRQAVQPQHPSHDLPQPRRRSYTTQRLA